MSDISRQLRTFLVDPDSEDVGRKLIDMYEMAADEIDRLEAAIGNMHPGFNVDEAIALFGQESS